MRARILSWSLGLICVSWVAGCNTVDTCRTKCDQCGAPVHGAGRRKIAARPAVKAETVSTTKVRTTPARPAVIVSEPRIPMESQPIGPDKAAPEQLPDIPALPMPAADQAPFKIEVMPVPLPQTAEAPAPAAPPAIPAVETTGSVKIIETPRPMPMEPGSKEQAIAVKSVQIQYGHGAAYETITGQVQSFRKTWRLRYASIEQEDKYGGTVVLEGNADLSKLRDGQHVRVRGVLVPPTERSGPASYRVQAIEILD